MPFFDDVQGTISRFPITDPYRITLEYLLNSGVGKKNAIPIDRVVAHLKDKGHPMTREVFQQTVLSESRRNSICIASSRTGIYLIKTLSDALAFQKFYGQRFQKTQAVFNRFLQLANQNWPNHF